jgi:hypothetical protein
VSEGRPHGMGGIRQASLRRARTGARIWPDTRTASPYPTGACYRWRWSPSEWKTMPTAIRPR